MSYKRPKYPNRLRVTRQSTGYTQVQVAAMLGFQTSNQIAAWENEHTLPTSTNLIKLCILYGKSLHDLYPEYIEQLQQLLEEPIV